MSVMMLLSWDGVTASQYDQLRAQVGWEQRKPEGGLFHVAAITPAGVRITDVWESEAAFHRFQEERLAPGIQAVGIAGEPKVEFCQTHAVFNPGTPLSR